MQVSEDYINELFACKLGNIEATPPDDGWVRIESELNRRSHITRKYWLAAASFALVLSVTASWVYIQTYSESNQPTIVSVRENTPQIVQEQSSIIDDLNSLQLNQNHSVIQPNHILQPQNEKSSSVPSLEDTATNYIDTWDELHQAQPMKVNWRKIMSEKVAQYKLTLPEKKTIETPAISTPTIPVFNEIAYFDITNISIKTQPIQRWEITGRIAPVHSYRIISSVPGGTRKSDFDDAESPMLAYSGGINLAYSVYGRWSIQTGVFYSQMGQSINNVVPVTYKYGAVSSTSSYPKNFVRTSSGSVTVASSLKSDANSNYASFFNAEVAVADPMVNISNSAKYQLIERFDYIEIPLMIRYKIIDRKLNLYVLGGMGANVLINNNVFIDNGKETVKSGTILMARPVNFSSMMGIGLGYHINQNLSVGFEPLFKYYLQSYTTSSQIRSNPYAFGLYTSVFWNF